MTSTPSFDLDAAHAFFATECFNRAWELIEQPDRSRQEAEDMVHLAHASLWHWRQRADCTDTNLSIGYWQISRVYALLGQADNARRYGQRCWQISSDLAPFYRAFAWEALARAELVAGNRQRMEKCLAEAHALAEEVTDPEEREALNSELDSLR